MHLAGAKMLPWHGIAMDERRMQPLPGVLRVFPGNYTGFQKRLFRLLKRLGVLKRAEGAVAAAVHSTEGGER